VPERDPTSTATVLAGIVARSAHAEPHAWFAAALVEAGRASDPDAFLAAYAGAARRLRGCSTVLAGGDSESLDAVGLRRVASWALERVARAALLCEAARVAGEPAALVEHVYRTGDNEERIALLGVLPALPGPERFVNTAVNACRTHVASVFEAVACDNPYPARHFADHAFNQMVLKALFLGVSLSRIEGLRERANRDLARMVDAYASERRAAGRSVPDDVGLILSLETR
jgi:hypothetical protein